MAEFTAKSWGGGLGSLIQAISLKQGSELESPGFLLSHFLQKSQLLFPHTFLNGFTVLMICCFKKEEEHAWEEGIEGIETNPLIPITFEMILLNCLAAKSDILTKKASSAFRALRGIHCYHLCLNLHPRGRGVVS